ncbi:MAG: dihydrofolate reductase family protein [Actinoallomurus sp.]
MRRLSISTFVSLDGVMQAPGGPTEDPTGHFTLGGWNVTFWDEVMDEAMTEGFGPPFELLLGRKTYEIFAAHWPYIDDDPVADRLNGVRKYVASRTLDQVTWNDSHLLEGDAANAVAKLKQEDGPPLQVQGSSDLIQTLLRHDLIDEFRVWTFPVILGTGKRLFEEGGIPAGLRLVASRTSATGVIIATYERNGEVPLGSFLPEEPSEAELRRRASLED